MKPACLRPALKPGPTGDRSSTTPFPFASSSTLLEQSPHVHFPPTPILTSTALTHSPHVYDRAPIRVSPNNCALPERGERTYGSDEDQGSPAASSPSMESYFVPRQPERMQSLQAWAHNGHHSMLLEASHERYDIATTPGLVPDMSSESDDSDQCGSPRPPNSPTVPMLSVQIPSDSGSMPFPYGGGFTREQNDACLDHKNLAAECVALPFARKVKKQLETNLDGSPKRKVKKPALERARKLSGSRCLTSFTPVDFGSEGCLGGF